MCSLQSSHIIGDSSGDSSAGGDNKEHDTGLSLDKMRKAGAEQDLG